MTKELRKGLFFGKASKAGNVGGDRVKAISIGLLFYYSQNLLYFQCPFYLPGSLDTYLQAASIIPVWFISQLLMMHCRRFAPVSS